MPGHSKSNGKPTALKRAQPEESGLPFDVGEVLRRMRLQRGLSVRDVAEGCGLSQSFLSMVERGDSDISLGRLAKIAEYFEHDIGSLLGYTSRISKPRFISKSDRTKVDRGPGITYEVIRVPGIDMELNVISLRPNRGFKDTIAHEGFDIVYVFQGSVILCIADAEYPMREGDCVYYSAAHQHKLVNRTSQAAAVLAITTGRMA
jgi:transcriptional regulator with XRE-family HTH domain